MKNDAHEAWQLKIELDGICPPIWRRILVSDRINLLELHEFIQEVFGWEDNHLHEFTIGGITFGDPENDEFGDFDIHEETEISLGSPQSIIFVFSSNKAFSNLGNSAQIA